MQFLPATAAPLKVPSNTSAVLFLVALRNNLLTSDAHDLAQRSPQEFAAAFVGFAG